MRQTKLFYEQAVPLALTAAVLAILGLLLYAAVLVLNLPPVRAHISTAIFWGDVLIGATIYLKTSVDFAIFMGRLMSANPGWKNRVAIEIGTALGNGLGTMGILALWSVFKDLKILLALMILAAALVLFELAYSGLEHFSDWEGENPIKRFLFKTLDGLLFPIIKIIRPVLSKILPDLGKSMNGENGLAWKKLLWFSFTVPFILGLDDFAGYVPLFSVVNVFGFGLGVMAAHTLLNIALFVKPRATVEFVRNAWISFLGTLAFIGLAIWGIIEAVKIFI